MLALACKLLAASHSATDGEVIGVPLQFGVRVDRRLPVLGKDAARSGQVVLLRCARPGTVPLRCWIRQTTLTGS